MRSFVLGFSLALIVGTAYAADDLATCKTRQAELSAKMTDYKGEPTMKRLIQADLERANREMIEGDADECIEALDHAAKLLAGDV